MYAKIFTSIYQGTLRGNAHGLLVFTNLLAHGDSGGDVDIHPQAIADEVGLSLEEVRAALLILEAPERGSRSPEHEGRRILRLDEHRDWGWHIVNYGKYRAIKNEDDRREQNKLAQQRWRDKQAAVGVSAHKRGSAQSAQAEAEAEALRDIAPAVLVALKGDTYRVPDCPYPEILKAYHETLPMLPGVVVFNTARRASVRARWVEVCAAEKFDIERGTQWFRDFFATVARSAFLTGRGKRDGWKGGWKADLEWLMGPKNFAKAVEGRYLEERA